MMSWLARQDGYDPNAFDVPGEQSTGVGWANRMGEILTARPQYDETVQYKTASPLVNITEGDIGRATEAAMGVSGGGMKVETPRGIRAYHSSPHDFDKFDLAKIGTGEGAQVYGHGLYFAESPAVSGQGGQYWQQFRPRFDVPERNAAAILQINKFDRDAAVAHLQEMIGKENEGLKGWSESQRAMSKGQREISAMEKQIELLRSGQPVGPRTYEVNINADPAHMLDWDKSMSAQPEVMNRIRPLFTDYRLAPSNYLGESVHKEIRDFHQGHGMSKTAAAEAAAIDLRSSGIPGIKYLDQGSRMHPHDIQYAEGMIKKVKPELVPAWEAELARLKAVPTSSNYVIFDPNIVRIDKKYAVPGALTAGGMGALAAQNQYEEVY